MPSQGERWTEHGIREETPSRGLVDRIRSRLGARRQPPQEKGIGPQLEALIEYALQDDGPEVTIHRGSVSVGDLSGWQRELLDSVRDSYDQGDPMPQGMEDRSRELLRDPAFWSREPVNDSYDAAAGLGPIGRDRADAKGRPEKDRAGEDRAEPDDPPERGNTDTRPKRPSAHTHGGTDAPECTTCSSVRPGSDTRPNYTAANLYSAYRAGVELGREWDLRPGQPRESFDEWREALDRLDGREPDSTGAAAVKLREMAGETRFDEQEALEIYGLVHYLPDDDAARPLCGVGVLEWFRGAGVWSKVTCERCLEVGRGLGDVGAPDLDDPRVRAQWEGKWVPVDEDEAARADDELEGPIGNPFGGPIPQNLAHLSGHELYVALERRHQENLWGTERGPEVWRLFGQVWHLKVAESLACRRPPRPAGEARFDEHYVEEVRGRRPISVVATMCPVCVKIADGKTPILLDWAKRRGLMRESAQGERPHEEPVRAPGREYIDILFDGPPAPTSGHFIEVEDPDGRSIKAGEWIEPTDDFYWRLRIRSI